MFRFVGGKFLPLFSLKFRPPLDFLQAALIWVHNTPVLGVLERRGGSPKKG